MLVPCLPRDTGRAMSQENVEVVRVFMEHTNLTGGEPLWELLDPDIEWIVDPTGLLAGTYRGHEGVREFFERLRESFDETHVEIDELIDCRRLSSAALSYSQSREEQRYDRRAANGLGE